MKLTVLVAVICLISIPETKAAPKLGLLTGIELPILGKINTSVNIGIDDQKGLLGFAKVFVKGLMVKATSSMLKRILPKGPFVCISEALPAHREKRKSKDAVSRLGKAGRFDVDGCAAKGIIPSRVTGQNIETHIVVIFTLCLVLSTAMTTHLRGHIRKPHTPIVIGPGKHRPHLHVKRSADNNQYESKTNGEPAPRVSY